MASSFTIDRWSETSAVAIATGPHIGPAYLSSEPATLSERSQIQQTRGQRTSCKLKKTRGTFGTVRAPGTNLPVATLQTAYKFSYHFRSYRSRDSG